MKTKLLLLLCISSLFAHNLFAQGTFFQELMNPMSGGTGPNYPYFDIIYKQPFVISQTADSLVANQWNNNTKIETTIDAKGRYTKMFMASWNNTANDWATQMNIEYAYTYNGQDKLTSYSRKIHQNDTLYMKEDMTYVNAGPNGGASLGQAIDSIFIGSMSMASGAKTDSFKYVGNNLQLYASWTNQGGYSMDARHSYVYNSSNQIISQIQYQDDGSGQIAPDTKDSFVYDAGGNILEYISSSYDQTTGQPMNTEKHSYTYATGSNRMMQDKAYSWNSTSNLFELQSTFDFHYNSSNLLDSFYIVDNTGMEGDQKVIVSYDANSKPVSMYTYQKDGSNWTATERYIYSTPTTGIAKVKSIKLDVAVYPNPNKGVFELTNPGKGEYYVCITDITGKQAFSSMVKDGHVDASSLSKGIYFYTISNNSGTVNGKFVIE